MNTKIARARMECTLSIRAAARRLPSVSNRSTRTQNWQGSMPQRSSNPVNARPRKRRLPTARSAFMTYSASS